MRNETIPCRCVNSVDRLNIMTRPEKNMKFKPKSGGAVKPAKKNDNVRLFWVISIMVVTGAVCVIFFNPGMCVKFSDFLPQEYFY